MNDCGEWVMEGMDNREQRAEGRTAPWPIKAPLWAPMTIDAHVNEHTQSLRIIALRAEAQSKVRDLDV